MIIPDITAIARSHVATVIIVTAISTKASDLGILLSIFRVGQANVPITTMNIKPTNAAIGINDMIDIPNTINNSKNIDAEIHDILPLQPLEILIID
jgi:hypothetical protein